MSKQSKKNGSHVKENLHKAHIANSLYFLILLRIRYIDITNCGYIAK